MPKILASHGNIGGCQKSWRLMKILVGMQNIGVCPLFGSRPNLQLLTFSWSGWRALVQILVDLLPLRHVTAQAALLLWAASLPYFTGWLYRPDMPKYTRMSKFLAATQILSRLLSVLSLSWKFVHNHCCCPTSAIILTVSNLEAILVFWQGCQNLSII